VVTILTEASASEAMAASAAAAASAVVSAPAAAAAAAAECAAAGERSIPNWATAHTAGMMLAASTVARRDRPPRVCRPATQAYPKGPAKPVPDDQQVRRDRWEGYAPASASVDASPSPDCRDARHTPRIWGTKDVPRPTHRKAARASRATAAARAEYGVRENQ